MEGWKGLIKEILDVLYPEVKTHDEMKEAFDIITSIIALKKGLMIRRLDK